MATITGTSNSDVITPTSVSGGVTGGVPSGAADSIVGGDGNDTINGGGGADTSLGGNGNDYIFAVLGTPESINGGAGIDTLDTTAFSGNYVVNLATGLTNFAGESFVAMENLISGAGNDSLTGTGGANLISGGDGNDTINGGGGADTSLGGNGNDYIFAVLGTPESINGGAGIDTLDTTAFTGNYVVDLATGLTNFAGESFVAMENLISGAGNDSLTGTGGANLISGGDGNDTINGGGGADTSLGGNGNDYIYAVLGTPESIDGGAGIDTLDTTAFTGDYAVNLATGLTNFAGESFINMNNLISGAGNDTLTGTTGANNINGGSGNDLINGGDGNDTLNGGGGADTSLGGNGNDYIYAVIDTPESIDGGAGTDTLNTTAFTGDYVVNLATGLTNFAGESFVNMENLISGSGDDSLTGTAGANLINGGSGNDSITGDDGDDTLTGGEGNDTLKGGPGSDSMTGGNGNDLYTVSSLGDVVTEYYSNGAGGVDTVQSLITYTLGLNVEKLTLTGTANTNGIGNTLANTITGNSGTNLLSGGSGADILDGKDGIDTLDGGAGADSLTGGNGNDIFQFQAGQANGDTITDFHGNGALAGDSMVFQGYGAGASAAVGSGIVTVTYSGGSEVIHLDTAGLNASDFSFV